MSIIENEVSEGLSPREAAQLIGICVVKLYSELASGRLRAKKIGKRTIVTRAECKRYLDALPDYRSAAHVAA